MHRSQAVSGVRFAFLALVLCAAFLVVPSVAFAADGHITGKVVDDAYKAPLEGISVVAYRYDPAEPTFMDWVGDTLTEADGTYALDVAPGQIVVEFVQYPPNVYLSEFYNGTRDWASATRITLGSGATVSNINASLGLGATISGKVTDQATGEALEGIRVTANFDEDNNCEAFSRTDGTYEITGLPSGTFQVLFNDIGDTDPSRQSVYVSEWYNNVTSYASATNIVLTAPASRTGVDAALAKGASIAGTVTESGSGAFIYNEDLDGFPRTINVDITDSAGNTVAWRTADAKGRYFAGGLSAGTYKVKFYDWGSVTMGLDEGAFYTTQWYNNKSSAGTANTITLGATTAQTGVNAAMVKRSTFGSISGSAYDAVETSRKIPGADVILYEFDGTYWNQAFDVPVTKTDANGDYRFEYVPAGTYRVLVNGYDDGEFVYSVLQGYDYQYYGGATDLLSATNIVVSGGGTVTARNVYLPRMAGSVLLGGALTNSATAASVGAGVPVSIYAYDVDGDYWYSIAETVTDASGTWRWPVESGTYKLSFNEMWSNLGASKNFVASWYDNKPDETTANTVTTILGGPTLVNDTLTPAFHFVGTVTGPSGALEGATVQTWEFVDPYWTEVSTAKTDASGAYDMGGIPAGTYKVSFSPPYPNPLRLATEYYDNKVSLDYDAGMLVLSGPAATYTLNAALAPGVEYKGRVFLDDSSANLDQPIKVHVWYNLSGYGWQQVQSTYAYTWPGSDGQWWMNPMPTGSYKFSFSDPDYAAYTSLYYLNRIDAGTADVMAPLGGTSTLLKQTMDGLPPVTTTDAVGGYKGDATISFDAHDDVVGVDGTYYSVDGAPYAAGTSVTVSGLGWHTVQYFSVDRLGFTESVRTVEFEILAEDSFLPVPVAGATRIDTAIKAAEVAFPKGADTVVIATAYNWPDALGGAALAGAYDGPILLTTPSDLPATVASAITDLGATDAVILGGAVAVSENVEMALEDLLGPTNVLRVSGPDRYRTAEAIAAKTVEVLGSEYDGMAFVSTGGNFPDALAASPMAAARSWPIYLVDKTKPLSSTTRQAMQAAGVTDIAILGGTGVVPTAIETSLGSYFGTARVDRLAGADRYETGCIVAEYGVANAGLYWNRLALATGQNFPDALAGGVLQGRYGSVLLLTPSSALSPYVSAELAAVKSQVEEVRYLGGLNAVSQTVRDSVQQIIQ